MTERELPTKHFKEELINQGVDKDNAEEMAQAHFEAHPNPDKEAEKMMIDYNYLEGEVKNMIFSSPLTD